MLVFGCVNQDNGTDSSEFVYINKARDIEDSIASNFALIVYDAATKKDSSRLKDLYIKQSVYIAWLKNKRPDLVNGSFDYFIESYSEKQQINFEKTLNNLRGFEIDSNQCELDSINYRYFNDKKKWIEWPESREYTNYMDKLGLFSFHFRAYYQYNKEKFIMNFGAIVYDNNFYFSEEDYIHIINNESSTQK